MKKYSAFGTFPNILNRIVKERARASVVAVGGSIDTAKWVARRLRAMGYDVSDPVEVEAISSAVEGAVRAALPESDAVIVAGGMELGFVPAIQGVASALGKPLVENEEARRLVEEYYLLQQAGKGELGDLRLPEEYQVSTLLPEGATALRNLRGPVPGVLLEEDGQYVVCLPGALVEASAVVEDEVDSYLRDLVGAHFSATVHVLTRTWDDRLLSEIVEEASMTAPWTFAELKKSVVSKDGWGVTVTVFSKDTEELSRRVAEAVRLVERLLDERGVSYVKKDLRSIE